MRFKRLLKLTLGLVLVSPSPLALSAEPKVEGLRFPLGQRTGENPVAQVLVEQISQTAQKRGFFRVAMLPTLVANGVRISFNRPEVEALVGIPETIRSLAKVDRMEIRRLSFHNTGDSSPKFVAEEVIIRSPEIWTLKSVHFPNQPVIPECNLILKPGDEGGIFFPPHEHRSLQQILDQK